MAYKDRMIASRSIAAAVREARIEMKKLADAKTRVKKSPRLPSEVRTALDAAVSALEGMGLKAEAKTITDAMWNSDLMEVSAALGELLDAEGGDELPTEVDDARYVVDSAMNGPDDEKSAGSPSSLPAPHRRGVPTSTRLREAVRRDLKSVEKLRGRAKADGDSPQVLMDMIEAVIESAEGAPGLPDDVLEALSRLSYDQDPIDLEDDLATIVEACRDFAGERTNFGGGPFGNIERAAQKALDYVREGLDEEDKSAGDSVATKANGDNKITATLSVDDFDYEVRADLTVNEDGGAGGGYDVSFENIEVRSLGRAGFGTGGDSDFIPLEEAHSYELDESEVIDALDEAFNQDPELWADKSAGDSVATKGVTTTADDLREIASRLASAGQEGYAADLEEAAQDLEEGDSAAASRMVTDVRRELEAYQDDEGMREIYDDVLDAALNLGRKSTSSVSTKASSLSDVEERLGAAMNAMGKASGLASSLSLDTEDNDEAGTLGEISDACRDIAGSIQAQDADDAAGIQECIDLIDDDAGLAGLDVPSAVSEYITWAKEALEQALELLSAYEGKSATGSKLETKDHLDPAEFNDRLKGVREGLNSLLEASEDFHETDAIASAIDMVDQAMSEAESNNWAGAGDLLSDARDYVDGIGDATGTIASLEAFRDEARGYAEDATDTYGEDKSYSAASRAKRRTSKDLEVKRAGEGEKEALEADYEAFAVEYMGLIEQASDAVREASGEAEEAGENDGEEDVYGNLVADIEDLGIEESFVDDHWSDGGYTWGDIAASIASVLADLKRYDLTDAAELLQQAATALKQFDGSKWYEQWTEESDASEY
jgi:hypothetical protein